MNGWSLDPFHRPVKLSLGSCPASFALRDCSGDAASKHMGAITEGEICGLRAEKRDKSAVRAEISGAILSQLSLLGAAMVP